MNQEIPLLSRTKTRRKNEAPQLERRHRAELRHRCLTSRFQTFSSSNRSYRCFASPLSRATLSRSRQNHASAHRRRLGEDRLRQAVPAGLSGRA